MNNPYLNLVFTRSVDGDHAALERWYSDHIGILWRCDALHRATLLRRDVGVAHEADYICCYAFADEAGFLRYEHGDARKAAHSVIVHGWGRDGITITERRQFRRAWSRRTDLCSAPAHHTVWCLRLGAGPWDDVSRWLVDRVHILLQGPAHSATLMRATDAGEHGGDVLLWAGSDRPLGSSLDWLNAPVATPVGHVPLTELRWHWAGQVVSDWQR